MAPDSATLAAAPLGHPSCAHGPGLSLSLSLSLRLTPEPEPNPKPWQFNMVKLIPAKEHSENYGQCALAQPSPA